MRQTPGGKPMAQTEQMVASFHIKEPKGLSPRIQWLRDYFFRGVSRPWNNEYTCWSTGTAWDVQYDEITYYICLLYTSDAADDLLCVDLGGRRIIKKKKNKNN